MTLEHFQSLPMSTKPFQLTYNQLIHIATENKIPIEQIISLRNSEKTNMLDRQQLCTLISQNNIQSMDESHRIQQRVYLDVMQIFFLAYYSNIKLDQLINCATENIGVSNHYTIFC